MCVYNICLNYVTIDVTYIIEYITETRFFSGVYFIFFLSEVLKLFDHDNKNTDTKMCLIKKIYIFCLFVLKGGGGVMEEKKKL